jgi:hypothetical protein
MAYTYETGTASSPSDLLSKVSTILQSVGWTLDAYTEESPGYRLHLHRGSVYLHLKSADTSALLFTSQVNPCIGVGLSGGTGYDGLTAWDAQAGSPVDASGNRCGSGIQLASGTITYWLYDDGARTVLVTSQTSTGYRHLAWGISMEQHGTWTGGAWLSGSTASFYLGSGLSIGYGTANGNHIGASSFAGGSYASSPAAFVYGAFESVTGWASIAGSAYDGSGLWPNFTRKATFASRGSTSDGSYGMPPLEVPSTDTLITRSAQTLNSLSVLVPIQIYLKLQAGGVGLVGRLPGLYNTNPGTHAYGTDYLLGAETYHLFPGYLSGYGFAVRKA